MSLKVTERDKKLLAGLCIVCLLAAMVALVLLPLHKANENLETQIQDNEIRMMEQKLQADKLPALRREQRELEQEKSVRLQELYPVLKSQDIDKLLTERAVAMGLEVKKLQITMPKEPLELTAYVEAGQEEDASEEPAETAAYVEGTEAIWAADARIALTGPEQVLDQLIDYWSVDTPGIRLTGFSWDEDSRGGLLLTVDLEILMSGCM